jgi:hypothetical protein
MRFSFGTVAQPGAQDDLVLDEFDSPEGLLFRVRVTSQIESKGLLLAEADRIRPRSAELEEEIRMPLLTVKSSDDLDQQLFCVDFEADPILLINSKVGDWRATARDPVFASLSYSATLREILTRILIIDEYMETEDDEDWRSQWLNFAGALPGVPELSENSDEDTLEDWINEAVESFCRQFRMTDSFLQYYWTEESSP